jgi:diguanylate cyclase (GGDEF)-like protein/PAS domain S-box-containing protein
MAVAFAVLLLSACAAGGVLVRADLRRRASEERFRDFANAGSDWFWETDAAGRFTFVSARFAEIAELDPESLIGLTRAEAGLDRDGDPVSWARLRDEMARRLPIRGFRYPLRTGSGRLCHFQTSGRPYHDEAGRFLGYRGAGSDVTHEVEAETRLTFLAKHDALTELPNRALLGERLRLDLARASREGPLAVLCVDLDRFKEVNDLHGHAAGDAVLREVAGRLREILRAHDTAARVGGDEFVVVLPGAGTAEDAVRVAERLVARLSEPYGDGSSSFDTTVGASVGVALHPADADAPEGLLRCADMAL